MGSDLARLLNPEKPGSPPPHPNTNCRRPRRDPEGIHTSTSPSIELVGPSSVSRSAGLQVSSDPQLTPPLTSSLPSPSPTPQTTTQTASWTAVNRPPPISGFVDPRADAKCSPDLAPDPSKLHQQSPLRSPPSAHPLSTTHPPQTARHTRLQSTSPISSSAAYRKTSSFLTCESSASQQSTPVSTIAARPTTSPSPFRFSFAHYSTVQPTATPPSPSPSPVANSSLGKPPIHHHFSPGATITTSLSPSTPPREAAPTEGLPKFDPTLWTASGDSIQHVFIPVLASGRTPRRSRRRRRSVRFVDSAMDTQMMPPPSSTPHQAAVGDIRGQSISAQPLPTSPYTTPSTLKLAPMANASSSSPPDTYLRSTSSGERANVQRCERCRDMITHGVDQISADLDQRERQMTLRNSTLEDYNRVNENLRKALEDLRKNNETLQETCPNCRQLAAQDKDDLVPFVFRHQHPRSQSPDNYPNTKRKPSEESSSEASTYSKRRATPESSAPSQSEHAPASEPPPIPLSPDEPSEPVRPIPFEVANEAFQGFLGPRPDHEEIRIPFKYANQLRNWGIGEASNTTYTLPPNGDQEPPPNPERDR